jgi:hypothetical protein
MQFAINAIVSVPVLLGFSSPFFEMVLVPEGAPRHGLAYEWFFGIPAEFFAVVPWNDASAMAVAVGFNIVQHAILFTALAGAVWLVRWTFARERVRR